MKRFIDVEFDEEMDMPCMCDSGNWFDLNDGFSSLKPNKRNVVVCPECHFDETNGIKRLKI